MQPTSPEGRASNCQAGLPATGVNNMLLTIAAILFILWILGFSLHVGGGIIHALLVIALIVAIFHFVTGRRVSG